MTTVVRDRMWLSDQGGYPYRTAADFQAYSSHPSSSAGVVVENWVTSEAMGIAAESLTGQVRPAQLRADTQGAVGLASNNACDAAPTAVSGADDADQSGDGQQDPSTVVLPGGVVLSGGEDAGVPPGCPTD